MEDEAIWWARFNACEESCRTFFEETCSGGRPERMDALDSLLFQLREKLLEKSQAEVRGWQGKKMGSFHPRFRSLVSFIERMLSRLAAASEWKAAGMRARLNSN